MPTVATDKSLLVVTVRNAALGTVRGVRTMGDVMAGVTETTTADEPPAVVRRPMNAQPGRKKSAPGKKRSSPRPVLPGRTIRAADSRADDDGPAARQRRATGMLKLGQAYLAARRKDKALKQFRKLLDQYPNTAAAQAAKKLMPKCR